MKHYTTIEPAHWPHARTTPIQPPKSDKNLTLRDIVLIRAAWIAGIALCVAFWGSVAAFLIF